LLTLQVGPKRGDAVGTSYRMAYELRIGAIDAAYLNVTLQAAKGPLSTSDHRIVLEGVPIEGGRSFVHLDYAYSYGLMAKLAMKAYLATAGRSKVGFTVIDQGPSESAPARSLRIDRDQSRSFRATHKSRFHRPMKAQCLPHAQACMPHASCSAPRGSASSPQVGRPDACCHCRRYSA